MAEKIVTPMIAGKSIESTEEETYLPIPGQLKMDSIRKVFIRV